MIFELLFLLCLYVFVEVYRSTKVWFCEHEPAPQPMLIDLVCDYEGQLDNLRIWFEHKKDEEYEIISFNAYSLENALVRLNILNQVNPGMGNVGVYIYLMPEKRILRYETLDVFGNVPDSKAIKKIQDQFERIPFPQDHFVSRSFGKLLRKAQ